MRRRSTVALLAALMVMAMTLGASAAFAGEVTGSGQGGPDGDGVPGAVGNAASNCLYSGLEDEPIEPGTVQNWGHTKDAPVVVSAPRGASQVLLNFTGDPEKYPEATFEDGCNPHYGGEA